jgi:hypothetical protein
MTEYPEKEQSDKPGFLRNINVNNYYDKGENQA